MSRTDKTRPLAVRVMDRRRHLEEVHDHTDGPCDLPPRPRGRAETLWGTADTRCGWVASHEWLCSAEAACGCRTHSKKRSVWAQQQAAADRTRNRRVKYAARVDADLYGADDLADVPDLFADLALDRLYGDIHSEVDHYAHLAEILDLPTGALVVGVRGDVWAYWCEACGSRETMDGLVEVLHPDGRRQVRSLNHDDFVVAVDRDATDPYEGVNEPHDDPFEEVARARSRDFASLEAFARRYL